MIYVAYGSNINPDQMNFRCPGAKVLGKGVIYNWKLDFYGKDGNGYATINQSTGDQVPVILWEMSDKDELVMDMYEGFPNSYFKKKIAVYIGAQKRFGTVYIMNLSRRVARPSRKYVNTVRNGYLHFGLDVKYLEKALKRNSEDFYNDDLCEVREFKTIKPAVTTKSAIKTFELAKPTKVISKKKLKKAKKNELYKASKTPFTDLVDDSTAIPDDVASYMRTNFPDDPYWGSVYGYDDADDYPDFSKKRPSLDYYDMKLK